LDTHRKFYGEAVWARIDRGRRWTPEQVQKAKIRHAIVRNTWASFFLTYDYLVMPVTPFPALSKADCTQANRDRLLALTTPGSLGGLSILTIPVPLQNGLTTGLQFIFNNPLSPAITAVLKR
jgi:amidase/aspartyl-tRNA(Asn)/glutamyl-tRNA(Gln) amidotransferase subunit A